MPTKVKTLAPLASSEPIADSVQPNDYRKYIGTSIVDVSQGKNLGDPVWSYPHIGVRNLVSALPDDLGDKLRNDPNWLQNSGIITDNVLDSDTEIRDDLCLAQLANDSLSAAYPGVDIYETGLADKFNDYRRGMLDYETMSQLYAKLGMEYDGTPPTAPAGYEEKFASVYADSKLRGEVYESFRAEQQTGTPGPISDGNPYADTYASMSSLQEYSQSFFAGPDSPGQRIAGAIVDSVLDDHPVLKKIYEVFHEYVEERLPGEGSILDRIRDSISEKSNAMSERMAAKSGGTISYDELSAKRYNEAKSELKVDDLKFGGDKGLDNDLATP